MMINASLHNIFLKLPVPKNLRRGDAMVCTTRSLPRVPAPDLCG